MNLYGRGVDGKLDMWFFGMVAWRADEGRWSRIFT